MKKNDHVMLKFEIALFVFAVINLIWAIIKSIQYNWSLFNIKGIDILVAYAVSVYIFHFSIRELMYFKKHKKIEHGYDERNIKVLDKSLRNVAITMFLIMMGSFYYFYLLLLFLL